MSSSAGTKKTKRRFRDLFKSRDSKLSSTLGTDGEPIVLINRSQSTHPLDFNSSSTSSSVPTGGPTAALSLTADNVRISSSLGTQRAEDGPESVASAIPRLNIRSGLGVAGRFAQTLLKKLPDCIDGNPVKMALSIIKTIIMVKDEIGDNKDALAEGLENTRLLLSDAIGKLELDDMEDVKKDVEGYKGNIGEQNIQLIQITQELDSSLRHLDYENYKRKVTKICKTITEITNIFMLSMQIEIRKTTAKMHEQMKEEQKERRVMSLQGLNPSRKADHKTVLEGQTLKRETCAEGTRVNILKDITNWANDDAEDSAHVFWLTGQAGSGKTTIAYTIAKQFEKAAEDQSAVLGSNFLCSRHFDETRNLSRIIPTIAYQLAGKCEPYEAALHDHVKDKSAVVDQDMSEQMEELLVKPWNAAEFPGNSATYLVVIDALDEVNEDGGSKFLTVLLTTINRNSLHHLKFFVTSRTDPDIVRLCDTFQSKAICRLQDVPIQEAEADIEKYLDIKLPKLVGIPELAELRQRAEGLFIYAATVVRILTMSRFIRPKEQIDRLTKLLSKPSSLSTAGGEKSPIDGLYEQVLYNAFAGLDAEEMAPRLRILFTFLCAPERISISVASTLMENHDDLATSTLEALHAVLYTQDDRVFWYHASFPDFIMDQKRSNFTFANTEFNLWCNQTDHHSLLALSCFRIMASRTAGLKFNMGGITSSYLLDSDCADEISTNVTKNISDTLRYACLNWGHHLSSSPLSNADIDHMCIYMFEFLQIRILFWIEAMHLLKAHDRCVLNLHQARGWVSKAKLPLATQVQLVKDLLESSDFATYFISSPASESTPHLYISSLATWKSESTLTKNWRNNFSSIPHFIYNNTAHDVPLLTVDLKARISSVAFSNDGTRIVAGLVDKTVQIIDASTGQVLKTLTGHTGWVYSVSFSNDDKWISSGSSDGTARLWDASTGTCLKVLISEGYTLRFSSVSISPNNNLIVSGSYDGSIRLWDVSTGNVMKIFIGHTDIVRSIAFSMDNTRIVSGSDDYSVRIWDVLSGEEVITIKGHTRFVNSVAYTNDNTRVVSASHDHSIRVWDATTGVQLAALEGHSEPVTSIAVFDSAYVLSGSRDKSVRIWDMTTGHTLKVLKGYARTITSVGYSNDLTRVVSGSDDGFVRVWKLRDVLTHADVDSVSVSRYNTITSVTSVAFSSDGGRIIFGSEDGSVHIWDLSAHLELRVLKESTEEVTVVAVSSSGSRFGWATRQAVWVWDASKQAAVMAHRFNVFYRIHFVGFSKEDKLLVLASVARAAHVEMWDEATGVHLRVTTDRSGFIEALSLTQDGQRIVSGSRDGSVVVWGMSSREILNVIRAHNDCVRSVAFSDDGSRIVSGSDNRTARVWDALTGSKLKVLQGHNHVVNSVAFASGDTRVISGSDDCTVRVWDVHTGEELSNLRGRHTETLNSIAVSTNSKFVISGSRDGSVIIWDLESPSWYLADTNWILSSPTNARLMWVPPSAQVVQRPNCRILVGESLYNNVDFARAMLAIGPTWEKCYTPNTPSAP